jgi:flavin-dependent dehydrogenase
MTTVENNWDAIVIGGGPAGLAVSAILVEYGHRVLVLKHERFRRFQIVHEGVAAKSDLEVENQKSGKRE